jgi:hypothetical protein
MLEEAFRPRARLSAMAAYGAIGSTMAVTVHFNTYVGRGLRETNPLFWLLHIGIFPLFFIFVFRLRAWSDVRPGAFGIRTRGLRWRELLPYFPRWVAPLVIVLWAYVFVNFFLSIQHLPPRGSPAGETDTVFLTRAFSGHWLVFYLLPTLFFMYVPSDVPPAAGTSA